MWVRGLFILSLLTVGNAQSYLSALRNSCAQTVDYGASYLRYYLRLFEKATRPPQFADIFDQVRQKMAGVQTTGMTEEQVEQLRMKIFNRALYKWKVQVFIRVSIEKILGNSKLGRFFKTPEQIRQEGIANALRMSRQRKTSFAAPQSSGSGYGLVEKVRSRGCSGCLRNAQGFPIEILAKTTKE
ncbi:hypothetical protein RUM43_008069 [Polyplax serrata]|uniref:Uncharacterized protein n=1 Tax=Polyplax serrata TaxID=468196 RepID=A0AAN8P6U0_POLSC